MAELLIVVALAAVLVIAPVALEQEGPVARVLAWRPLVWLGTISLSMSACVCGAFCHSN